MSPVLNKKVLEELKRYYKASESGRRMLDYLAGRENNSRKSLVERMGYVTGLSRADVIEVFREFEKMEFGRFVIGRRGQPSRFEWDVAMVSVGLVATGEGNAIETDDIEEGADDGVGAGEVKHTYRLRPDVQTEFTLPENLTSTEAARLAEFIKTLPF